MKKVICCFLVLTFLLEITNAFAKKIVSDTTHKIGVGLKIENIEANSFSYMDRNADRDNGVLVGALIDYGITKWFSLELAYSSSLKQEIKDTTLGVKLADFEFSPLTLSAKFKYISSNPEEYKWIVPYLLVGIGYYSVDGDISDEYKSYNSPNETSLDFDGGFGWHAGTGVEFFLNDKVSMGIEGRYLSFSPTIKETVRNPIMGVSSSYKKDVTINAWTIGITVKFYFDFFKRK